MATTGRRTEDSAADATPEMVEAAVGEIIHFNRDFDDERETVRRIWRLMSQAAFNSPRQCD